MKNFKLIASTLLVLLTTLVFSAPAPPFGTTTTGGSTVGSPGCWPPPCVPIDNGIIFLIAAGLIFAAVKFYGYHKTAKSIS